MQQWNGQKHFLIESTFSLSQNANKRLKELNNIAMINLVILKKEQSN